MTINKKQGIIGALAATVAIGAAGLAFQARTAQTPRFNLEGAPAVASTTPAGPAGSIVLDKLNVSKAAPKDASSDNSRIARVVASLLYQGHYSQQPLDAAMSARFMERLLEELDPQHIFFLQSDLKEFDEYRKSLAELTAKGDVSPASAIFARFKERVAQQTAYSAEVAKTGDFTFAGKDTFLLDRSEVAHPATLDEARKLWRERVRYEYLQEKLNGSKPDQIVKDLTRRYDRTARAVRELDEYDIAERYLTSLAHAYDPHTDYLGKSSTEAFNINFIRLSLFGIGAQLVSEDGYTKIVELIPGGPAERGGELKPGDRIVSVAQGKDGQPVDVVDMKIDKVVEMIRGPKDTVVCLTVIPAGAPDPSVRKTISIVRDKVKIEEQEAKGRIIEMPDASGKMTRVGVIDLPTFYMDPQTGKGATTDIAAILKKFEEQNVSGVILDLRRNGGGLLTEAVTLTGLFIKQGPVVQVKDFTGRVRVESDRNPAVAYDGPLVVLTSRFSASASEIVAGALQDYGRAVVVGDGSTYGKGTVQVVQPLEELMQDNNLKTTVNPGTLHLTVQKFYRASGASTQLKGVTPDIVLPAATDALEVGEKYMKFPLPWDTIESAKYEKTNRVTPYLAQLKQRSQQRLASDADFKYLVEQVARTKENITEKTVSLNEKERREELNEAKARAALRRKQLAQRKDSGERYYMISVKDARKPGLPTAMTANQLLAANKRERADDEENKNDELDVPEIDFHLEEGKRILRDYINLTRK
ncbi:MAG: carboxy terminal-processing peptidase [Armatimonadaceae bacterium]